MINEPELIEAAAADDIVNVFGLRCPRPGRAQGTGRQESRDRRDDSNRCLRCREIRAAEGIQEAGQRIISRLVPIGERSICNAVPDFALE